MLATEIAEILERILLEFWNNLNHVTIVKWASICPNASSILGRRVLISSESKGIVK